MCDTHFMSVDINTQLEKRKIEVLFDQAPIAISAGTVAAFICVVFFWHTTATNTVNAWFGLHLLVYAVRYILILRFNNSSIENRNYQSSLNTHLVFSMVSGLLWSTLGIYLLASLEIFDSLVILLMIGGLIAGVVATNSVILSSYIAFSLPAAIPVIAYLFIDGSSRTDIFGLVLTIFLLFVSFSVYRLNKLVIKSLSYQFDNLQLLDALEAEKNRVSQLYNNLEFDLARQKETEEQLNLEKQKAEQMVQSLLAISTLDGLTGIPNRRHFDSVFAREWNRASRTGTPVSLIICDIDNFKAYNDNYGHPKGDNCLIRIATLLQEHARREGDVAARYGGEEFAIILPATSLENAKRIAGQMRAAIEKLSIPHRFSSNDNIVTASFGVATIVPGLDQHSKVLISKADKAMYQAKQKGRNCVVTSTLTLNPDENKNEDKAFG